MRHAPATMERLRARAIVLRRLAITDMAAKVTIDRWIREAGPEVAKLAEFVAAADKQGLQGQPFRNVMQMLALAKKEATAGLSLPFGPMVVGSSK